MHVFIFLCIIVIAQCAQFQLYFDSNVPQNVQDASAIASNNVQKFLVLNTDVNILVEWVVLAPSILGDTTITSVCKDPFNTFIILPPALYVQLYGNTGACQSYTNDTFYHMVIQLNSARDSTFYYNASASRIAPDQYDIISVIMHEICHGLGFQSQVFDAEGNIFNAPDGFLFDWILFESIPTSGWPQPFGNGPLLNPVVKNADLLTANDHSVVFPCAHPFPLYNPSTFTPGVSISHTSNYGLMYYRLFPGQTWRTLNVYIVDVFRVLGYTVANCAAPDLIFPCGNCEHGFACFTSDGERIRSFLFS